MNGQLTIFDIMYPKFKIDRKVKLIEMFGGYGSQYMALKRLGIDAEHHKLIEWAAKSIQAYNDIHIQDYTDYSKNLSDEEVVDKLYELGVSLNYNEPAMKEQLKRQKYRTIYNNIIATNDLVNIQKVKGEDLEIKDTNKYIYICTYSFPCQDLSVSGKGKGMSDTSTRSGMLWEVERILTECKQLGDLPQILLMENVIQVHSLGNDNKKGNVEDFNKWQLRLEELGYKNYFQDLIATDYGIPQTRNRCFMVSILGDYSYSFPKPIPLKLKLKDMLEDNVDEKYYLSDKMMKCFLKETSGKYPRKERFCQSLDRVNSQDVANTITTLEGNRDTSTFIKVKNNTDKGYLEAHDGDGIDLTQPNSKTRRGRVQKDTIQTLTTQSNFGVVTLGNYMPSKHNASRVVDKNYSAPTIMENHGTMTAIIDKPKVLGGIGKKDSNNNTQWKQQNRVYDDNVAIAVTTSFAPFYKDNLRIRKLTPRESLRLMGVSETDITNMSKNQSDSSLYHLAGDSIVVDVLYYVFKQFL